MLLVLNIFIQKQLITYIVFLLHRGFFIIMVIIIKTYNLLFKHKYVIPHNKIISVLCQFSVHAMGWRENAADADLLAELFVELGFTSGPKCWASATSSIRSRVALLCPSMYVAVGVSTDVGGPSHRLLLASGPVCQIWNLLLHLLP